MTTPEAPRRPDGFFGARAALVGTIACILDRQITRLELDRAARNAPANMTAHDLLLQADAPVRKTEAAERGANIAAARDLHERAAAIDPLYAGAVEGIANTYLLASLEPLGNSALRPEFQAPNALKRAGDFARKAVEPDETSATARATPGWILNRESGPTEGLVHFDQALPLIRQAAAQMPSHRPSHVLLAAISAEMGAESGLPDLVRDVFALDPEFTIEDWLACIRISDSACADRLRRGLLAAGLRER